MRPKNYKGRCIKKKLNKCREVAKLYDKLQINYSELLEKDPEIKEISVNYLLQDLPDGEYTSDFVCMKNNGDYMVRECIYRKKLLLPRTCKLLDASRLYWEKRGINDWGIIIEKVPANE